MACKHQWTVSDDILWAVCSNCHDQVTWQGLACELMDVYSENRFSMNADRVRFHFNFPSSIQSFFKRFIGKQ